MSHIDEPVELKPMPFIPPEKENNKVVKGWRKKYDWEDTIGIERIDLVLENSISDEGWICPYCNARETCIDYEMSNDEYFNLIQNSWNEPIRIFCNHCDKEYFLKAHVVIKYETCKEDSFE